MSNETSEMLMQAAIKAYNGCPFDKSISLHAFQYITYRDILRDAGENQSYQPHTDIREHQINSQDVSHLNLPQ